MKPTDRPGAPLLRHLVGLLTLALALVPSGATLATSAPTAISTDEAIAAVLGRPVGATLQGLGRRVSQTGPDGNADYGAASPGLAWNATENEYLVVWWGDTDAGGLLNDELEIWGRVLRQQQQQRPSSVYLPLVRR